MILLQRVGLCCGCGCAQAGAAATAGRLGVLGAAFARPRVRRTGVHHEQSAFSRVASPWPPVRRARPPCPPVARRRCKWLTRPFALGHLAAWCNSGTQGRPSLGPPCPRPKHSRTRRRFRGLARCPHTHSSAALRPPAPENPAEHAKHAEPRARAFAGAQLCLSCPERRGGRTLCGSETLFITANSAQSHARPSYPQQTALNTPCPTVVSHCSIWLPALLLRGHEGKALPAFRTRMDPAPRSWNTIQTAHTEGHVTSCVPC